MKKFLLSIFAVMLAVFSVQAQVWTKVTDASTLQAGDKVVIVAKDYNYAMSKTQNSNNRGHQAVTKSGNEVSWTSGVQDFELKTGTKSNTFAFYTGSGYLYAASSSSNYLRTQNTLNDNASWAISIAADGTATVKAQGTYTRNVMQYNQSSSLFACYSSASQKAICIYKYTEKADDYVEAPRFSGNATFVGSYNVEITATAGKVYYSYSEGGEFVEYAGAITITDDTTIYAKAVNGENESAIVSKTYTRVAATPVVTFDGDGKFENEVVVTISAEDATIYYTLDGKTPSAKSTEYTKALTIKADATLKVIAIEEGGYESSVVENKFQLQATASAGNANAATLVTNVAELAVGDQIVIVATNYDYALSTTQNGNNRGSVEVEKIDDVVSWSSDVQVITLENGATDGTYAFNVGDGYLYAASSSSNHLKTQSAVDAKASWTVEITDAGVATIKAGEVTRNWLRFNNSNSPKIFSCYGSGQTDVSIYKVDVSTVADYVLNVTEAGWATMYLGYNVIIPEDVNCYVIGEIDGAVVNLNQVEDVLPANTAVIVEAAKGEYTFEVTEETSTVENVMEGTLKNEYITKDAYVLGVVDGEVGLYKADMAGGVWLNNANKAYLPASVANGAASYSFRFGEGTTGIDEMKEQRAESKEIYDLTGRKVESITERGIYIVGGKKVLVK
ncbi:MAG: chitobiase/beta-hexosaminidase C-terminal domain-containing protein [Bacteroidaceae bacterium]|nr:chitobiase/beta-hexosaminidase C-terminal domain-containing protein [Bacteroidaceae bacterium]